jgi:hypothetical protein
MAAAVIAACPISLLFKRSKFTFGNALHSHERQNLKIFSENNIKLSVYYVMCDWNKEVQSVCIGTNDKQVRKCSQCETLAALSLCYCPCVVRSWIISRTTPKTRGFSTDFSKRTQYQLAQKSVLWEPNFFAGKTEGRAEWQNLVIAFRN